MATKYAYVLCDECREKIARLNRAETRRRRKAGKPGGGRPFKQIDGAVIARVRRGTLTLEQAAKLLQVSTVTVRRRLLEMIESKKGNVNAP